jgi:hypothetical protein
MKRVLLAAIATAAFAVSTPAAAVTLFYQCGVNAPPGSSCISDTNNVNLNTASNVGLTSAGQSPGTGYIVPDGPTIDFTSTTDSLNLDASGQATITAMTGALNNLTFTILGGSSISTAEFNLVDLKNVDFDVTLYTLLNGVVTATSQTFNATGNGSNRFGVVADGTITGVTINSSTGFGALTQLRLTAASPVSPVPELATWAMMLIGFGGIGMTMRRKQRPTDELMQVA